MNEGTRVIHRTLYQLGTGIIRSWKLERDGITVALYLVQWTHGNPCWEIPRDLRATPVQPAGTDWAAVYA